VYFDDEAQEEDLFSLDSKADLSAVNNFGQTPLHVRWLNIGFRLERDDSFRQRDGRRRTSWHHMFIFGSLYDARHYIYDICHLTETDVAKELEVLRMFPEVPVNFQSKRCMLKVAGCNESDDVGRTPLHYAAMQKSDCYKCHVEGCSLYCKCYIFLFGIDSWCARDKWGRIPLHYAYLNGFVLPQFHRNVLPSELTDAEEIQDIDSCTPKQMLDSRLQHEANRQRLKEIKRSCLSGLTQLLLHCSTEEFFSRVFELYKCR